ncbi:16765_t:CDS:10 [Funneliformis geosporum]|uniref:406_t:CDS:1 n=1 Tax=Funneliformis geosporum TaxID=1117311 RepID=A0A9W4SYW5_9GLOM|nr:406_t:CDS:10 [Funneliformis geosporum]CAI2186956.1 16765_t:CDS:10 [Funneliformis geosporum]
MSPIALDNTIIEQNPFEPVELTNGLTKDPTKPFTNQEEQPQQQQLPQREREQESSQDKGTVQAIEDIMQVDDESQGMQDNTSLEPKPDQQTSSPQQLSQLSPQPEQEVQVTSSQVQLPNSDNVEIYTTNSSDMEDIIECSLEETLLNENEDYEMVSRAVNVLKFQLEQAKEDIKKLKEIKQNALSDPITYIEKLRDGTNGKIPERQYIFGVPQIDWSKYHTRPSQYKPPPCPEQDSGSSSKSNDTSTNDRGSSPDLAEFVHKKAQELGFKVPPNAVLSTRTKRKTNPIFDDDCVFTLPQSVGVNTQVSMTSNKKGKLDCYRTSSSIYNTPIKQRGGNNTIRNGLVSAAALNSPIFNTPEADSSCSSTPTVPSNRRNNKKVIKNNFLNPNALILTTNNRQKSSEIKLPEDSPKPVNYNIPWTDEEQRRLVELLAIYPDEEIQSHRFKKISEALGTRTPKQVASRVQKYFIKLAKHGLPVPGRIPSVSFATTTSKNSQSKNKKSGRASKPKPPSLSPEKRPRHPRVSGLSYLEERPPPTVYMPDDDDESMIKDVMLSVDLPHNNNIQQTYNVVTGPVHHGFCCDGCHTDPIIGTRYLCTECDESHEVDLCEDCFGEESFENEFHKKTHKFSAITNPITPHIDMDYVSESVGEYSYLGVAPPPAS